MTVAVAGIGAITAVGLCAGSTMAAQRAGISGQAEHAYLLDREGEPMRVAAVPWGEADGRITGRLVELAVQAAQDAMARADGRTAIDVMLALPESRPGLPEGFAVEVGTRFAEVFRKGMAGGKVKVLPRGHAGGLALMGQAATLLRERPERAVLVGGVDSWLVPETLEWLDAIEALHSDAMPWGFCPGEAAAFCLLCGDAPPDSRLVLLGAGHAVEWQRIRTRSVCIGEGLSAAWRGALDGVTRENRRIDQVWSDLNSEPYRGDEIALTVARTREHLAEAVEFVTPADSWGDVGAATGPLLLAAAEVAASKNYAAGPMSLLSASSDGGPRAALIVCDRLRLHEEPSA
jgi:3-oxoacyl-[acyl-carrier-protein] synthase-1